ncbi:MAG TPA: His/Gly/Thr/Pro-type tRNA ligase C-terminal domain-containing protein, partial [Tepidisphaeraceae bacterium]|nr:His/Gly/Thr/Pro-type tRNA ligase C-terminal domain-containing protein [Tepidisphaeraceae bacterium]
RVEADLRSDKIGAKIREATLNKIPYMLICGEKEVADGKVAVRHRTEGDKGAVAIEEFIAQAQKKVAMKEG